MKFYVLGKKQILRITSLVLVIAAVCTITVFASSGGKRLPIYCVETDKKEIAISFDAAWGCDDTQTLIDILAEYEVPATFFIVGQWVQRYPEAVKMLSDAGHSIQNHSSTHPKMSGLSADAQIKEINDCNNLIQQITGVCPTLFRAPYGDYNNTLIESVESVGMYTIQWDVETLATKVIV